MLKCLSRPGNIEALTLTWWLDSPKEKKGAFLSKTSSPRSNLQWLTHVLEAGISQIWALISLCWVLVEWPQVKELNALSQLRQCLCNREEEIWGHIGPVSLIFVLNCFCYKLITKRMLPISLNYTYRESCLPCYERWAKIPMFSSQETSRPGPPGKVKV